MSRSPIITPEMMRNAAQIGGHPGMHLPPSLDELVEEFLKGLKAASEKDLNNLPALQVYDALHTQLVSLGMPKLAAGKALAKIKIGVPESFIQHQKFEEFMKLFALMVYKLYRAVQLKFGEDEISEDLFLSLVGDRFALVLPVA